MDHSDDTPVLLELVVRRALPGCAYAIQVGKSDLDQVQIGTGGDLLFRFSLTFRPGRGGENVPHGPVVQGRGDDRFLYICSGQRAGQAASTWDRRMKVPLRGIAGLLPHRGQTSMPSIVEASVCGVAKDGGPACASIPLVTGWELANAPSILGADSE